MDRPSRPNDFLNRYRLYLDESGDHAFKKTHELNHRFLCLLGCWFSNPDYLDFHKSLIQFKEDFFHSHPDDPIILHREDIINKRGPFKILQTREKQTEFDEGLLRLIKKAEFKIVAVVIDKDSLREQFGEQSAHPYHLGLGFLLQRYIGFLNHVNRVGDVLAESRGKREDIMLRSCYDHILRGGIWGYTRASDIQSALTSKEIKIKPKNANIAGLQLADLLCHPVKKWVLRQYNMNFELGFFANRLIEVILEKFNHHLYNKRIEGYGYVLYPKQK